MAWLHATPKPPPGSDPEKQAASAPTLSRLDQMKADKIVPQLPPNPAPLIVLRFIDMGMTQAGAMGPVPLSWSEIDAWQRCTAVHLAPWEASLIRTLSIAYVGEMARAEDANCPPPWLRETTQRERVVDEEALDMVLG